MRLAAVLLLLPLGAAAQDRMDQVIASTFPRQNPAWQARVTQDETQRQCSLARNEPSQAVFDAIRAREQANITLPADGQVLGAWRGGEAIAQNGRGNQFSDPPGTPSGGNCYACHQMAPAELSYGTLGPSLAGYGRIRAYAPEEARAAYAKIWNPQAVTPCSTMPRFGHNGVLTAQQIKDVVAYLFDPASPVNK